MASLPFDSLTDHDRDALALEAEHEAISEEIKSLSERIEPVLEEHIELATGRHYWSERYQRWRPSKAVIELIEGVGVARQGGHRVLFAPNLADEGSIDIATPDGRRLRATVLALAYVDVSTGRDVVIGKVKPTFGSVVGSNQVVYRDAFDGVEADVVYTYRRAGLEQDVVLRSQFATPQELGLNPETTQLEVMTEWFDSSPRKKGSQVLRQRVARAKAADLNLKVVDEQLSFGSMGFVLGRAFWTGPKADRGKVDIGADQVATDSRPIGANGLPAGMEFDFPELLHPMTKRWLEQDGRSVLLEAIDYSEIESLIKKLPPPRRPQASWLGEESNRGDSMALHAVGSRNLPALPARDSGVHDEFEPLLASATTSSWDQEPGLVLDYYLAQSATDFRFEAGRTYRVVGPVILNGTTVIEGTTVVKYDRSRVGNITGIRCLGPVICETGPYHPAIFTAVGDAQYGSRISYEPVTDYYARDALWIAAGGDPVTLEYVRIKHAEVGVRFVNSEGGRFRHAQILDCRYAVATHYEDLRVENVLIDGFTNYAFWAYHSYPPLPIGPGDDVNIRCENVTVNRGSWLAWNSHWNGVRGETEYRNSLLVNVNGALVNGVHTPGNLGCVFIQSEFLTNVPHDSVFETQAAGKFYLPVDSPYRDRGTASIDQQLAQQLTERTTTAPVTVRGAVSGSLWETVPQDEWPLDLGYHYDRIDFGLDFAWVWGDVAVHSGVIVACARSYGMYLAPPSGNSPVHIQLAGAPGNPVICVDGDTVQEQAYRKWESKAMAPSSRWGDSSIDAIYTDFYGISRHFVASSYWNDMGLMTMRHCRFTNVGFWLPVEPGHELSFYNCLFNTEGDLHFEGGGKLHLTHCLIRDTSLLRLYHPAAGSEGWRVEHNVFDESGGILFNPYASGFHIGLNAKIPVSSWWLPGNVISLAAPYPWQEGPLGAYYQPVTDNPLLEAADRYANQGAIAERLTHYTVRDDLVPEGGSLIDLGFHYLATDANGNPLDDNRDGIANAVQDTNANGIVDGAEIDWRTPVWDADGDGLSDSLEILLGTNPTNADTDGDGIVDATEISVGSNPVTEEDWDDDQPFAFRVNTALPSASIRVP